MKILFLSAWYPNRYDPMPGLFVKQHAEAVAADNEVAVLYVHPCNINSVEIVKATINNVYTVVVYYPAIKSTFPAAGFWKAYRFFKVHFAGYKIIKQFFGKPELLHVNILTRCGVMALIFKMLYSVPYLITEHWSRYPPSRNAYMGLLRKLLTKLVVGQSEGIATVSQALKEAMINCGLNHKNFMVIHNSVDTSVFKPSEIQDQSFKKVFSHISCFDDAAKNITGILRAVDSLRKIRSDFIFQIIGDGPDRRKIEQLSESLGLTHNCVVFKGLAEGKELMSAYQQSLFTVLFSNYENMPVVVAESFSCGVPVIATDVGGLTEIVNSSNGLLIKAGDELALTLAMNEMLETSSGYHPETIRQYAEQKFGLDVFKNKYAEFYSLAAKKPA